ncbi:hypothetical protein Droror1_Dr00000292 [Drosera rotundifolia]
MVASGAEGIDDDGGWTRGNRKEGDAAACQGKRGRLEKKIGVLGRTDKKIGVGRVGLAVEQRLSSVGRVGVRMLVFVTTLLAVRQVPWRPDLWRSEAKQKRFALIRSGSREHRA